MVRVKICSIASVEDAQAAVAAGADAIGLNFVQESPRCIAEQLASDIRLSLPPFVHVVGVFADRPMREVHRLATRLELDYIQLHGNEQADSLWHYQCPVIRAVRVREPESLELLPAWDDIAAAVLLDGRNRPGQRGEARFDPSLIEHARKATSRPIILGGGLTPENVAETVRSAQPFAVDVTSSVESEPGRKDPELMRRFVIRAKLLDAAPSVA
jgi:phosphoribosylanthranilate isomerase